MEPKIANFPLRIEPPSFRGVNALRIEIGAIAPRCLHRPKSKYAWWLLEHRPHHAEGDWSEFKPCVNESGCTGCRFEILNLDTRTYEKSPDVYGDCEIECKPHVTDASVGFAGSPYGEPMDRDADVEEG